MLKQVILLYGAYTKIPKNIETEIEGLKLGGYKNQKDQKSKG